MSQLEINKGTVWKKWSTLELSSLRFCAICEKKKKQTNKTQSPQALKLSCYLFTPLLSKKKVNTSLGQEFSTCHCIFPLKFILFPSYLTVRTVLPEKNLILTVLTPDLIYRKNKYNCASYPLARPTTSFFSNHNCPGA